VNISFKVGQGQGDMFDRFISHSVIKLVYTFVHACVLVLCVCV